MEEKIEPDTDVPLTLEQMADAYNKMGTPTTVEDVELSVDPDDYPVGENKMKCLMCRKELTALLDNRGKIDRCIAIDDGGTVEVSFGYGSIHDCKTALGFVCDGCFEDNLELFVNHYDGLEKQKE